MMSIGETIALNLARRLVDKAIKEVNYFCHFETHVHQFVQDNNDLVTKPKKKCKMMLKMPKEEMRTKLNMKFKIG